HQALRGAHRGHPGGPDRDSRGLSVLRQEGVAAARGLLVERGGHPHSPPRGGAPPALHALALPCLRDRSARDLHRLLAVYPPPGLPRAPGLAGPRRLFDAALARPRLAFFHNTAASHPRNSAKSAPP